MKIKRFDNYNSINENKEEESKWEEKREEAKLRKNLYEREDSDVIHWDDLELDIKRDLGEFTDIKTSDAKWIIKWLENKVVGKIILK